MDDQVAEVEQQPSAIGRAFLVPKVVARGLQLLFQILREGLKLGRRLCRGDHEVVGERRGARDIEQGDIEGLMLAEDVDGAVRQCFGVQKLSSLGHARSGGV